MSGNYHQQKELNKQSVATISKQGERVWIHPKKPKGSYHNKRLIVSLVLLVILFGVPFLKMNGMPMFLFHVMERKFIIFGQIFWPQDFYLIVIGFLTALVFIVLFTVVFGRVFCGWVCPQTIFMEMVFRKIEYWIEGDYRQQKKLMQQEWDFEKIWKKTLKHFVFILMASLISHTFWAYIIGLEGVLEVLSDPMDEHTTGFIVLTVFTGAFYWVFSSFREQVCIIACPYGRLQGVMLDKNSLTVIYDFLRGENRGKNTKNRPENAGDCIDCNQCVDVCPTGIDIRNGTQLECINCTACMDACDGVMELVGKPKGLVRVDSEDGIEKGTKLVINTRIIAYGAVLVVLLGVLTTLLLIRDDVEITVLRSQGQLFQRTEQGTIKNLYKINLLNKTMDTLIVSPKLLSHQGQVQPVSDRVWRLEPQGILDDVLFIEIPRGQLKPMNNELELGFYNQNGEEITKSSTKFLAP